MELYRSEWCDSFRCRHRFRYWNAHRYLPIRFSKRQSVYFVQITSPNSKHTKKFAWAANSWKRHGLVKVLLTSPRSATLNSNSWPQNLSALTKRSSPGCSTFKAKHWTADFLIVPMSAIGATTATLASTPRRWHTTAKELTGPTSWS